MLSPREQMNRSLDALLALWAVLDAMRLKDGGGSRLRVPRKSPSKKNGFTLNELGVSGGAA
jgi:hypothetical protein